MAKATSAGDDTLLLLSSDEAGMLLVTLRNLAVRGLIDFGSGRDPLVPVLDALEGVR